MPDTPRFSVVIPTCARNDLLALALALGQQFLDGAMVRVADIEAREVSELRQIQRGGHDWPPNMARFS